MRTTRSKPWIIRAVVVLLAGCLGLMAEEEPAITAPRPVLIVPVRAEINDLMRDFIARNLDEAAAVNARAVVFDMHTPGGLVSSAMDISAAIKASKVKTLVWVRTEAISAGALISLACDEIVVAEHGRIGDCAPIMIGPEGVMPIDETYRAKIDSYILAEFRDSAKAHGYPMALSEAMVRPGPAVYRIVHDEKEQTTYVSVSDLRGYGLLDPDKPAADTEPPTDQGWKIDKKVLGEKELLTMIADEAIEYGFAKARVHDETELAAYLGVDESDFVRSEMNLTERLVSFLTSPLVRGLLILVLILSFYAEMQAPGIGIFGALAAACLIVLLGAPYLTGMTNLVEMGIILVGVVLIGLEIFLIPGFGVAGISGIVLVLLGLVLTFVPPEPGPGFWPTLQGTWDAMLMGLGVVVVSLSLAMVGIMVLTRYFGAIPLFRRLEVAPPAAATIVAGGWIPSETPVKVGDVGRVTSVLHPVGRAEFEGQALDVMTHGEMVQAGRDVRIIEIQGNRIVVERA